MTTIATTTSTIFQGQSTSESILAGRDKISNDAANGNNTNESTAPTIKIEEMEEKKTEEVVTEEMKLKYADWPYRDIKEPHPNDVLYGRGGTYD